MRLPARRLALEKRLRALARTYNLLESTAQTRYQKVRRSRSTSNLHEAAPELVRRGTSDDNEKPTDIREPRVDTQHKVIQVFRLGKKLFGRHGYDAKGWFGQFHALVRRSTERTEGNDSGLKL
jgi:hypothetical protein